VTGGAFRAWGVDHKEVPLRVPTERHGAPTNVELKASDASANPYLSLAGIIAAGLDGIERDLKLPEPVDQDPALLSEQERQQRRIDPLPGSLEEALGHFQNDPVLRGALGEPLAVSYVAVKPLEVEATRGLSVTDEVQRLVDVY
jgi:glutamine synthetase